MKFIVLFIAPFLLLGCMTYKGDISTINISEITVLDSNFNKIRVINDYEQLETINRHWQQLERVKSNQKDVISSYQWTHKLDIKANILNGRWLYNDKGDLAKLNYNMEPMYKVKNPATFYRLILDE